MVISKKGQTTLLGNDHRFTSKTGQRLVAEVAHTSEEGRPSGHAPTREMADSIILLRKTKKAQFNAVSGSEVGERSTQRVLGHKPRIDGVVAIVTHHTTDNTYYCCRHTRVER